MVNVGSGGSRLLDSSLSNGCFVDFLKLIYKAVPFIT